MEVTKTDISNPVTQDNSFPAELNTAADLFFNLILQTAGEFSPQAAKSNTAEPVISDSNKIKELDITQSPDNLAIDNSTLLAQLNMLINSNTNISQSMNFPEKIANSDDAAKAVSVTLPSSLAMSSAIQQRQQGQQIANMQLQAIPVNQANKINLSFAAKDYQTVNEKTSLSDLINTTNINGNDSSSLINTVDNHFSMPIIPPKVVSDHRTDQIPLLPEKSANQRIELDAKQNDMTTDKVNDSNQQNIEPANTMSKEPVDQSLNQQDMQNVPNKYIEAFAQLGNTINSQTVLYLTNHEQRSIPGISIELRNDSDKIGNGREINNEPKIELSIPSLSSVMKEGYDAKIKIYPPELGHVIAKLRIDKNSTNLVILTENNHVKSIVEANLPKLRDSFQQAAINLTDIQVQASMSDAKNQHGQQEDQRNFESYSARKYTSDLNGKQTAAPEEAKKSPNTIIDTYA